LGAAATEDDTQKAALPFDRRRHGLILGMGACAFVVESEDAVRERGMRAITEVLGTEQRNSAFHGTRLDPEHIASVLDQLLCSVERRFDLDRHEMASRLLYVSHETYTPARGGSASAEVKALRHVFGISAERVLVTNTKGLTGHPMGVGIEDVVAVKSLEHGRVPEVINHSQEDPELGFLNLSRGGRYPVHYAVHVAAGFGSQLSISLFRKIPGALERMDDRLGYQRWLDDVSGLDRAEVEVVCRNLRIRSTGAPGRAPAPSRWTAGTGPSVRSACVGPAEPATVTGAPASSRVIEIVAEMAGYPIEMIDLEFDLETDLGFDTSTQMEVLSRVREACRIPAKEEMRLDELSTIKRMVQFVDRQVGAV
jgi:hypothetical protein